MQLSWGPHSGRLQVPAESRYPYMEGARGEGGGRGEEKGLLPRSPGFQLPAQVPDSQ